MTVSYTHPHSPFVSPQRFWDLYRHEDIDPPRVPEIPYEQLDVHSQWLYVAHEQNEYKENLHLNANFFSPKPNEPDVPKALTVYAKS
ncbi:MAG: hypothetical protein NTW71_14815 [Deltaproteobacteria bacterium]|nr:hypothetical protein [Deltaproteobacteria bacterium]